MTHPDEPTRELHRPTAPPVPMPAPLNPATPPGREPTGILPLDELFDQPIEPVEPIPPAPLVEPDRPAAAELPLLPPVPPSQPLASQLRRDARAAWDDSRSRLDAWIRAGDHALLLATILAACLLLILVAAL